MSRLFSTPAASIASTSAAACAAASARSVRKGAGDAPALGWPSTRYCLPLRFLSASAMSFTSGRAAGTRVSSSSPKKHTASNMTE